MHNGCDKCRPSGGKAINWDHLEQIASRKGMEFEDVLYICLECRGHWFYQWWEEERYDGSEWGDIYEQLFTISEKETLQLEKKYLEMDEDLIAEKKNYGEKMGGDFGKELAEGLQGKPVPHSMFRSGRQVYNMKELKWEEGSQ
jgi:hypothetical protein